MTPKQKAFCDCYIASGNATEAAQKAGYSKKTAYSIGQRLLKNVETQKYIAERGKEIVKSRIASAQEVLEFFSGVMKNDAYSPKDRIRAAENLAKRFGLDKPEQETAAVESGAVVNIVIADTSGEKNDDDK